MRPGLEADYSPSTGAEVKPYTLTPHNGKDGSVDELLGVAPGCEEHPLWNPPT
jgi:hypothetical protein